MQKHIKTLRRHAERVDWKRVGLLSLGGMAALLLLVQLLYPGDRILPFAAVDGVPVGGKTKAEAAALLNQSYETLKLPIYLGKDKKPFAQPALKDVGIKVDNTERVKHLSYPWYLRIIPTSLFWAPQGKSEAPTPVFTPTTDTYITAKLLAQCHKAPIDASLKPSGDTLSVVSAVPGGTCESADVVKTIKSVKPSLKNPVSARVAQTVVQPAVKDAEAKQLGDAINKRVAGGIAISLNNSRMSVEAKEVLSWLDFPVEDGKLTVKANADKAANYLNTVVAPKVTVRPGVSYVTTRDFTEISRTNGASGQALDVQQTLASVDQVMRGELTTATVVTKVVPPTEQYTRTYSPTDAGLSALLENYAKDHKGTFGITLIELDGKKRRASYNGDKQFVTASTYKLFVAYSLLKRIDAGTKDWDSNASCFNKMISYSDNACAEMFLNDIGLKTITSEINAIGLKDSNFTKSGGPFTTPNDLALLLGMIQSGQNFSPLNRDRLINAMKANVYRNGIPAGANGTVADKVGFLDALLHDAAIVYSPSGTYVLAVMTDGSTWGTIADLAKQIDTLRAQ